MTVSAMKQAIDSAERLSPKKVKQLSLQINQIAERVESGTATTKALLGIEKKQAGKQLQNHLRTLKRQQAELHSRVMMGTRYHRLSLEPLTGRDKNGYPRLVVFNLNSPRFELTVRGVRYGGHWEENWNWGTGRWRRGRIKYQTSIHPKLPKPIRKCYADVTDLIREKSKKHKKSMRLICSFEGLIPQEVKEKIPEARKVFGNNIFIIAEPKGFELTKSNLAVSRPIRDPLLVGFKDDNLWLIVDFETTPVEEAMVFTSPDKRKK